MVSLLHNAAYIEYVTDGINVDCTFLLALKNGLKKIQTVFQASTQNSDGFRYSFSFRYEKLLEFSEL